MDIRNNIGHMVGLMPIRGCYGERCTRPTMFLTSDTPVALQYTTRALGSIFWIVTTAFATLLPASSLPCQNNSIGLRLAIGKVELL